jgi:hypothetical protein
MWPPQASAGSAAPGARADSRRGPEPVVKLCVFSPLTHDLASVNQPRIATDTALMPRYRSETLHLNNLAPVNHRLGQFVGCSDPKTTGVTIQIPHTPSATSRVVDGGSGSMSGAAFEAMPKPTTASNKFRRNHCNHVMPGMAFLTEWGRVKGGGMRCFAVVGGLGARRAKGRGQHGAPAAQRGGTVLTLSRVDAEFVRPRRHSSMGLCLRFSTAGRGRGNRWLPGIPSRRWWSA